MCGERRRGRDICFQAVNWMVLLIAGEVSNSLMLSCTCMIQMLKEDLSHGMTCTVNTCKNDHVT